MKKKIIWSIEFLIVLVLATILALSVGQKEIDAKIPELSNLGITNVLWKFNENNFTEISFEYQGENITYTLKTMLILWEISS